MAPWIVESGQWCQDGDIRMAMSGWRHQGGDVGMEVSGHRHRNDSFRTAALGLFIWQLLWDDSVRKGASFWLYQDAYFRMTDFLKCLFLSLMLYVSFFQLIWKRVSSFNIFFAGHLYATIKVQRQCEGASMRRAGWGWQHKDGCIRRAASGWLPQDCDVRTAASGQRYDDSSIRMVALEWQHQDSCIRTVVSGWCCQKDRLLKKNYLSLTIYVFFLSLSKKE